jgi:VanZ family protein
MNPLKLLSNIQHDNRYMQLIIFISYAVLVTSLSLKPHVDLGELPYNDKLAHGFSYALFTFLGWRTTKAMRTFTLLTIGIFVYSGLIELLQSYTGRTMSFGDLMANGVGIMAIYFILRQRSSSTTE